MAKPTAQKIKDEVMVDAAIRGYGDIAESGNNLGILHAPYKQGDLDSRLNFDDFCLFLAAGTNMKVMTDARDGNEAGTASAAIYLMEVTLRTQNVTPGTVEAIKTVFGDSARTLLDKSQVSRADELEALTGETWTQVDIDDMNAAATL
jgi:precorrin-2 methylase